VEWLCRSSIEPSSSAREPFLQISTFYRQPIVLIERPWMDTTWSVELRRSSVAIIKTTNETSSLRFEFLPISREKIACITANMASSQMKPPACPDFQMSVYISGKPSIISTTNTQVQWYTVENVHGLCCHDTLL